MFVLVTVVLLRSTVFKNITMVPIHSLPFDFLFLSFKKKYCKFLFPVIF